MFVMTVVESDKGILFIKVKKTFRNYLKDPEDGMEFSEPVNEEKRKISIFMFYDF